MSHLDEGTIHALLDGELSPADAAAARRHAAECGSCAARLAEAESLLRESDRLIGAIELPPEAPASGLMSKNAGDGSARSAVSERRRRFASGRTLAWAASVAVVVGAGYAATRLGSGTSAPRDERAIANAPPRATVPATGVAPPAAAPRREDRLTTAKDAPNAGGALTRGYARRQAQSNAVETMVPGHDLSADLAEAAGRLGVPPLRLEGLTLLDVAIVPGSEVAGADSGSDVVRLRYRDSAGTLVTLEQQRAPGDSTRAPGDLASRKSEAAAAAAVPAPTWWSDGPLRLRLSAPVAADSLLRLRALVR
jgi:hypothetical protein